MTLNELYQKGFETVTPNSATIELLKRVFANDDEGDAYELSLRKDRFFTQQTIELASKALKKTVAKSLSHATALFGKETIRNFVMGHSLQRLRDKKADQLFVDLSASKGLLKRSLEAEKFASKLSKEYLGVALCSGYVFDLIEQRFLIDPRLQPHQEFFENHWRHSVRTACIAHAFSHHPSVLVRQSRLAFGAGLLHDVGRLLLAIANPEKYFSLLKEFEESRLKSPISDEFQLMIERDHFGIGHPEIGSFFCNHLGFVSELESAVDFHHEFAVLKPRDPDSYILADFVSAADRIAFLSEGASQLEIPEIQKATEACRPVFPLSATEVLALCLALRSKSAWL